MHSPLSSKSLCSHVTDAGVADGCLLLETDARARAGSAEATACWHLASLQEVSPQEAGGCDWGNSRHRVSQKPSFITRWEALDL